MSTVTRRVLAATTITAALGMPVIVSGATVALADTPSSTPTTTAPAAPKLSTGSAFGADKPKTDTDDKDKDDEKPSLEAIQKVLTSIQDAKKAEDLDKELDKDIDTLTHNESAVPSEKKQEFNKFVQELRTAKDHKLLEGDHASDTFKEIQADAKKLSGELK